MTPTKPSDTPSGPTRSTSKREIILGALTQGEDFQSAQDLYASLRVGGQKVGLATVYRLLQQLSTDGEVDVLRNETGEATYRSCSQSHHHHLVCRVCGKTIEVQGPTVERWADKMAAEHGYRDISHTVEIFGVCASH